MRPGERRHNLGECPQVQVDQAADGVVVVGDIPLRRERAEATGAIQRVGPGSSRQRPDLYPRTFVPLGPSQPSRVKVRVTGVGTRGMVRSSASNGGSPPLRPVDLP